MADMGFLTNLYNGSLSLINSSLSLRMPQHNPTVLGNYEGFKKKSAFFNIQLPVLIYKDLTYQYRLNISQ